MSHFTVAVRVLPGESLDAIMAPYQENNMGDCPAEYLKFHDMTDELKANYETDMISVFIDLAGESHQKYQDRFRVDGKYTSLPGWTEGEKPAKEFYSFEAFARDYHGYKFDADQKAFGYWENPNKKWDWWTVGGRWSGKLDGADMRTGDWFHERAHIDYQKACRDAAQFVDNYTAALAAGKFPDSWTDPLRSRALNFGLVQCLNIDEISDAHESHVKIAWVNLPTRFDVCAPPPDTSKFVRDHWQRFHPFHTFAHLDSQGWHEPGEMGWFGCSNETPESQANFDREFVSWLNNTPDAATVYIVDCHI